MTGRYAIITAAVVLIVSGARVLVVANYQTSTAVALLSGSSTVTTLAGTIVPLLPALLPLAVNVLLAAALLVVLIERAGLPSRLLGAAAVAAVATLFVSPTREEDTRRIGDEITAAFVHLGGFWYAVAAVVVAGMAFYVFEKPTLGRLCFGLLTIAGIAVMSFSAYSLPRELQTVPDIVHRVWLPAEVLTLDGGVRRVGYVISSDAGFTTVLWDDDRSVARLPIPAVRGRDVCRLGIPDRLPLIHPASVRIPAVPSCYPAFRSAGSP